MAQRKHLEPFFRKHLSHLRFEIVLLPQTPEIIHVKKSTARKKFSETRSLLVVDIHAARFDNVRVREGKEFRIRDVDDIGMRIHGKTREAMNSPHEFAIRAGIVRGPTPSLRRKETASSKFRTMVWLRLRHRSPRSE